MLVKMIRIIEEGIRLGLLIEVSVLIYYTIRYTREEFKKVKMYNDIISKE